MRSQQPLLAGSKIASLPDDLRGIAKTMLRKKFGHESLCSKEWLCEDCGGKYCEDCAAPYNQFSQIDWNMCVKCYEARVDEWGQHDQLYTTPSADDGVLSMEYLSKIMADAQEQMIQPDTFIVAEKAYHQLTEMMLDQYKMSINPTPVCDFGFEDKPVSTVFGMDIETSSYLPENTIIMKSRNMGKSYLYKTQLEQSIGRVEAIDDDGNVTVRMGRLD